MTLRCGLTAFCWKFHNLVFIKWTKCKPVTVGGTVEVLILGLKVVAKVLASKAQTTIYLE